MAYQPPFTITSKILTQVASISEHVGRLSAIQQASELKLRRANRIRTIQGSLAIEGNTLSEEQITAILEGKRVIAPPKEILEVRNAIKAYEKFEQWHPTNENDLLEAHLTLMKGLLDEVGCYRTGGVGVMSGGTVIHMAPGADRVSGLMADLFAWLARSEAPALVSSCVFHYEFEFIHPFADGNGRMGRLWQTLILSRWNPVFANIPVESLVYQHQQRYYQALQASTDQTDSAVFIEFMLETILEAIESALNITDGDSTDSGNDQVIDQVSDQVARLIVAIGSKTLGAGDIMAALDLSHKPSFREHYLNPALDQGWIERTQPESPRSPTQKYRLTVEGKALLGELKQGKP